MNAAANAGAGDTYPQRVTTQVFIERFRGPMHARVILADPETGDDLFVSAACDLKAGEALTFVYPDEGLPNYTLDR